MYLISNIMYFTHFIHNKDRSASILKQLQIQKNLLYFKFYFIPAKEGPQAASEVPQLAAAAGC